MKINFKKHQRIIALIAFMFVIFLVFNLLDPLLLWDENAYLGNARSHLTTSNYTEDFRFPLLEWIIAAVWFITGESIFIAKLTIILFSLGIILLMYLISKEFFPENAFLLSSIFSFSFPFLFWGFRVYTEIPALFFIMLSFYLLTKEKTGIAGLIMGFAFLTKFQLAIFAFSAICIYLYKKEFKKTLIFSAFFIIAILPWLIYNYVVYHNFFWDFIAQYKMVISGTSWQYVDKGMINLFYSIGLMVLFLPFGIYSMSKNLKKKKANVLILLFYTILSFIYYNFFVKAKDIRYYLFYTPFLIIISYEGFNCLKKLKKLGLILIIFSMVLGLTAGIVAISKAGYCSRSGAIIQSIEYLRPLVNQNDTVISNYWPWPGYYLNVKAFSVWTDDLDELNLIYHHKYFAINDRVGYPADLKIFNSTKVKLEKELIGKCGDKSWIYRNTA